MNTISLAPSFMKRAKFSMLLILLTLLIATLAACTVATPMPDATDANESADTNESAALPDKILVGTEATYPPFESVDEAGNIVGFDIDLFTEVANRAGVEVEFQNTAWDGIFVALANGEFDAVVGAVTITPERLDVVDFTDPYFNASQGLAVRVDNDTITGKDDLVEGVRIGAQLGTTGAFYAADEVPAEAVEYALSIEALIALSNGDVDAAIIDAPALARFIEENPELNVKIVDDTLTEEFYGFAVSKELTDLTVALNEALAEVQADGSYDEIYARWFEAGGEAAETGADDGETTSIVVGTNAEYQPFEFVDENGEIVGFDIDLMNALAEVANLDVEYVNTKWDGIFVALASGEFDAVISAVTITEERREVVDFTEPYFNAGQGIAVQADNETIASVDDLTADVTVGVQLGTTGDFYVTDEMDVNVARFDETPLAITALANGDVDAVVADAPTLADYIRANPDLDLKVVGEPFTDELYGIAVNKDLPDVLAALNAALAQIQADGTYDAIYDEWFGTPE